MYQLIRGRFEHSSRRIVFYAVFRLKAGAHPGSSSDNKPVAAPSISIARKTGLQARAMQTMLAVCRLKATVSLWLLLILGMLDTCQPAAYSFNRAAMPSKKILSHTMDHNVMVRSTRTQPAFIPMAVRSSGSSGFRLRETAATCSVKLQGPRR
jgi:hypothetical protein